MTTDMRRLLSIMESADLPPGFERERGGDLLRFVCSTGSGVVSADFTNRVCTIYEFQSDGPQRSGYGRRTLEWMKQHFHHIDVVDPGDEGTDSRLFWEKMKQEGLVNTLYDDEMRPLRLKGPVVVRT